MPWATEPTHHIQLERCPRAAVKIPCATTIKTIQEIYDFDTEEKQRKFLLRIITEKQVDAIFNELPNPMEVLEQRDVERLKEVKGIGETTAERIIKKFLASKDLGKAMVELGDYGLTNNMILKLVGEDMSLGKL